MLSSLENELSIYLTDIQIWRCLWLSCCRY